VLSPVLDQAPPVAPSAPTGIVEEQSAAPAAAPPSAGGLLLQNRPLSPRFATWWSARHAVVDRPILGAGPGQFRSATIQYRPAVVASDTPDAYFTDAHNFVVETVVTLGAAGLAALLLWLTFAARSTGGSLAVFAAVLGVAHLFQPLNVGTTPLALLALGAAGVSSTASPGRRPALTRVAVTAALLTIPAALAFLLGAYQLGRGTADFDLAVAKRSEKLLRPWPEPAQAVGFINQYEFVSGRRNAALSAREALLRAARRDPSNPARWSFLGEVSSSHGEWTTARQAFDRALTLDPTSPRALRGAARLEANQAASRSERS